MVDKILGAIESKRNIWSDRTLSSEFSRARRLVEFGFPYVNPKELFDRLSAKYSRYTTKQLFIRAQMIADQLGINVGIKEFLERHPEIFRGSYEGRTTMLTSKEVWAIMNVEKPDWLHNVLVLMLYGALRKFETFTVRWDDYENEALIVRQGKGRKNRTIPFPDRAFKLLRKNDTHYVVHSDTCIPKYAMQTAFKKACIEAGVEATPHDLRAYRLQSASAVLSQKELQEFAGHASYQTTLKYLVADKDHMLRKLSVLR